ncbi:MAG: hypothetical protein DMG59_24610 [Acidobacteria bacterium]|nr:MAG: hypothetical protein DMG59_24610 [Acidobacteriota bacterium]
MTFRLALLLLAMLVDALTSPAEILDRVAVTVGKQVITESDVIRDLRVSAFLDQKPLDLSGEQKRKAADRLVDQILILQETESSRLELSSAADAAHLLDQVKSQYATEADYRAALARYRITEQELLDHLSAGLRTMRFTDLRFRPEVEFTEEDLRDFYQTLAVDWRRANPAHVPSFEESRGQVEKLLTEQTVMQALDRWLGAVRTETQILYRDAVFK